jgi:hypothetical protein
MKKSLGWPASCWLLAAFPAGAGGPGLADPMTVREILKMGDERLLRVAQPVRAFGTPELRALIADMEDTMKAANGAGLAAPQIGVDLQLVIFGTDAPNPRYPMRRRCRAPCC